MYGFGRVGWVWACRGRGVGHPIREGDRGQGEGRRYIIITVTKKSLSRELQATRLPPQKADVVGCLGWGGGGSVYANTPARKTQRPMPYTIRRVILIV